MKKPVLGLAFATAMSLSATPVLAAEKVNIGVPSWTGAQAIAHLLAYLESGDTARLDAAATAISELSDRIERHENRYWTHYIQAHRALEEGDSLAFVSRVLRLWQEVVVPLEALVDTHS